MSVTFFILAVILLFFFSLGPGEQVIAIASVFISSTTGFGSVILMRKMAKSDAEMHRKKSEETKARGNLTMDEWLKK